MSAVTRVTGFAVAATLLAPITIAQVEQAAIREPLRTNPDGYYSVPCLPPGDYAVSAGDTRRSPQHFLRGSFYPHCFHCADILSA
jgi:hypothetical protein